MQGIEGLKELVREATENYLGGELKSLCDQIRFTLSNMYSDYNLHIAVVLVDNKKNDEIIYMRVDMGCNDMVERDELRPLAERALKGQLNEYDNDALRYEYNKYKDGKKLPKDQRGLLINGKYYRTIVVVNKLTKIGYGRLEDMAGGILESYVRHIQNGVDECVKENKPHRFGERSAHED